jgi:uncharacterized protein
MPQVHYMNAPSQDDPFDDPLIDTEVQAWERTYATFTHLSALAFFAPVVVALVLWLIKKEESPFVNDHGKEAVNFQISLVIYWAVAVVLAYICVGLPLMVATVVLGLVGCIMGAVAAKNGRYYRYPMCLRLVS